MAFLRCAKLRHINNSDQEIGHEKRYLHVSCLKYLSINYRNLKKMTTAFSIERQSHFLININADW